MKWNEGNGMFPSLLGRIWSDDFFTDFESELPAVNVKENKKAYTLEVSIPGYEKEDVDLKVDNNVLHVVAKRETKKENVDDDDRVLRQEFASSSFYRSFALPENVDTDAIEASQHNGVLTIKLPKMEKALVDKRKTIAIK
jgi:HSP20 family protein